MSASVAARPCSIERALVVVPVVGRCQRWLRLDGLEPFWRARHGAVQQSDARLGRQVPEEREA
mgnify:CR=1 FL=1